jgi:hypothetical protein
MRRSCDTWRAVLGRLVLVGGLAGTAAAATEVPLDDLFPRARGGRVLFRVEAPEDATVTLVGDFNGWNPTATPLAYAGRGVWEADVPLAPGEYEYKYVVNGRWLLDRSNPDEVSGEDGSIRSRLEVLPDGQVSEKSQWTRHPRPRRDRRPPRLEHRDFVLDGQFTFNRVDGSTFWIKPAYRSGEELAPEFDAAFGYGYESERVNIEADFAQPVVPSRALYIGVHLVDGTAADNQAEIGLGENTMAALLFKHDFMDYYDMRGVEPYVRLHLPGPTTLRFAYASEDYAALTAQTQWSFFRAGRDRFRPNPGLYLFDDPAASGAGRLAAARFEIRTDTRRARSIGTVGFFGRGFVELGGGDFDYARWTADGRAYLRLGRPAHLALRLRGGSRFDAATMPSQKLFYVGGLGTVRGHAFRTQRGDRELLGNLEYTFLFDRLDWGAMLFYDAGTAWDSRTRDLADTTLLQAIGFGFKTSDDDFQVNFAKPLDVDGGIETTVRLNRTF